MFITTKDLFPYAYALLSWKKKKTEKHHEKNLLLCSTRSFSLSFIKWNELLMSFWMSLH